MDALLLLPLIEVLRAGPRAILRNRQKAFLFYWAVLPFVFFSLAQNKLPGYLLPILPPLSLWIALIAEGKEKGQKSAVGSRNKEPRNHADEPAPAAGQDPGEATLLQKLALWLVGLSALMLFLVPVIAAVLGDFLAAGLRHALAGWNVARLSREVWRGPVPPAILLFLVLPVGVCLYLLWRRNLVEAAFLVMVGVALCMMGIVQYLSFSINRVASVRMIAQRMQSMGVTGEEMGVYRLPRNQSLGLDFYMDRALPEWTPPGSPASVGYVVSRDEDRLQEAAQSRIFFPGQHVRVWVLPRVKFEIQIEEKPHQIPGSAEHK